MEMPWALETSKPAPSDMPPPLKPHLPPTGDQIFQCTSLWELFLFKPPQTLKMFFQENEFMQTDIVLGYWLVPRMPCKGGLEI